MKKNPKILVVRTDRLGDVLMCLPTLEFLRGALPNATLHWHFSSDFQETLKPFLSSRNIQYAEPQRLWKKYFQKEKYTALLMLHGEGEIARAAFAARVPTRLGMYSRPMSFVLFNAGIRQKRSRSEKSEAEYNLELGKELVRKVVGHVVQATKLPINIPSEIGAKAEAKKLLETLGLKQSQSFVVLHPGMGGSALNLDLEQYVSVATSLLQSGKKVVLSVGPHETDQEMAENLRGRVPGLVVIEGQPLHILREVFRLASTVIAPSTGPIHLAHYVGTPTVGIYSPVKSHHPIRWAPWGGTAPKEIVFPEVDCPGKSDCIGASCPQFYCMDKLAWGSLILKATNGLKV